MRSLLPTALTATPLSITLLIALTCAGLYLLYLHRLPVAVPGVPHNKAATSSILGDIPSFVASKQTPSDWFLAQARLHASPLCQVFLAQPFTLRRSPPLILVSDFREAQDVLLRRKGFDRSDYGIALLSPILPEHHINLKTGPLWKMHRRLIQDLMLPSFLHKMAGPNIYKSSLRLMDLWREKALRAEGRSVSVQGDIYHMALDAVLDFTFADALSHRALPAQIESVVTPSDSFHTDTTIPFEKDDVHTFESAPVDDSLKAILRMSDIIGDLFESPVPSLTWNLMRLRPSERKSIGIRQATVKEQIRQAVDRLPEFGEGDAGVKSAIDMMMLRERQMAEKEGREPQYSSSTMIDEILGFVVAGHDTTSTTLLWLIKFLTDNPSSQSALRDALTTAHSTAHAQRRIPSIHEIINTSIPYLDASMEEGLRCASTIPLIERQCDHDTVVLGHHFPKGTTFFFLNRGPSFTAPPHSIHESLRSSSAKTTSRSEWDPNDMNLFRPERWLDESGNYDSTAGPVLPFGLGTRGCYGRRLAYLEMRIVVTLMIWNFHLLPPSKELSGYEAVETLTYKPKNCYVRLQTTGLADGLLA